MGKAMQQQEDIQHAVPNIVNAMQASKEKETALNQQVQWRKEKLQMIDRDIAQVEAWTNATALRYKEEKDRIDGTSTTNAAAASDPTVQKEEEKAQERASRVVRCLNLARGTEVFKVMENALIRVGALSIN